ncbi:MAG TPA: 5-oxoprolinase subunit PxpB [Candidatus Limnocylindria bacterium]|nr:5-oxoprolinase subunit PxpB [Candidatus Limnocylindria bacterium]
MTVRAFGDSAFLIELEQRIDPAIVETARALADLWETRGLGEAIPAYASVVLRFEPSHVSTADALTAARELALERPQLGDRAAGRVIEIPTTYDGPDLEETAALSGMTAAELVAAHAGREYQAFFLGFMPGLAYCGLLHPGIVAPRRASPRARVPAGSVAVANGQTIVYPFASPGGWRLIGRTDLPLFDPSADPPARIRPADRVRFVPH